MTEWLTKGDKHIKAMQSLVGKADGVILTGRGSKIHKNSKASFELN